MSVGWVSPLVWVGGGNTFSFLVLRQTGNLPEEVQMDGYMYIYIYRDVDQWGSLPNK